MAHQGRAVGWRKGDGHSSVEYLMAEHQSEVNPLLVDHAQLVARARHLCGQILDGRLTAFDGATLIWRECHLRTFKGDHTFDPFVYWQDEYEDAQSDARRQRCAEIITQFARAFLDGSEVVLDPPILSGR
jgi:hypothetical protein